jgi:mono/diheme cytochrome c family protein
MGRIRRRGGRAIWPALAVLALAGPAAGDGGEGIAEAGAAAYVSLCGRCHGSPAGIAHRFQGEDEAARRDWLDRLLGGHHAEGAEDRAAIVAYLLGF